MTLIVVENFEGMCEDLVAAVVKRKIDDTSIPPEPNPSIDHHKTSIIQWK